MDNQALIVQAETAVVQPNAEQMLTVQEVKRRMLLLQDILKTVMEEGTNKDYGKIPGCGDKPALFKAGAEKLSTLFQLLPRYEIHATNLPGGHREFQIITTLHHAGSDTFAGQGVGSCSTMETKFRFRKAEQTCPNCGKETIIKGKQEYGGGWLCYQKRGGCGAKFKDGDPVIENQNMGRVEHDNPADYFNTCLKQGKKRSLIDAILNATMASALLTQDIEEDPSLYGGKAVDTESPKKNDKEPEPHGDYEDPEYTMRNEIQTWGMEITFGNVDEFKAMLRKLTEFEGKDGKVVSTDDVTRLKGKYLNKTHHAMKEKYQVFKKGDGLPF